MYATCHSISFPQKDSASPSKKELKKALEVLTENKVELKYGDLVSNIRVDPYRNDGLSIYDGNALIDLDSEVDDYGALPSTFEVLVPDPSTGNIIPPTYWHQEGVGEKRGVSHNNIVWFNHIPYKNEILSNMTIDTSFGVEALYSWITIQGERYYIMMSDYDQEEKPSALKKKYVKYFNGHKKEHYVCDIQDFNFEMGDKKYLILAL
jgi:hypothetical protein